MSETKRIRWTEDAALAVWSGYGHAGERGAQLFTIAAPLPNSDSGYLLMSRLPGMEDFGCSRPRLEDAQAEAERWLSEFVASLGAIFPAEAADEIVRWRDVRTGDLVLLGDELITAEKVSIVQKPWGDETTFAAADISHRLDNGYLAVSEQHGDRYTAVRRGPAPPEPPKGQGSDR